MELRADWGSQRVCRQAVDDAPAVSGLLVVPVVMAVVMARVARHPRSTFVRTTVVLTALSLVPDVIAPAAPTTKALLMLTHLVAAAIVIPAVARKLA